MESNEDELRGFTSNLRNSVRLSISKIASGNIPVKLLKGSEFIFPYLANYISEAIIDCEFLNLLKLPNIMHVCKKKDPIDKEKYIGQLAFYLFYRTFIKRHCMGNFTNIWITF